MRSWLRSKKYRREIRKHARKIQRILPEKAALWLKRIKDW